MEDKNVNAVRNAIAVFLSAVEKRDIKALEKVVAPEKEIVFYGSQAGDKQVGWPAVKKSFEEQFSEVGSIKSQVLNSKISVVGDLAWAVYDLRYSEEGGGTAGNFDSRWTCVLRRYPDGWKFVHMHHSRGR